MRRRLQVRGHTDDAIESLKEAVGQQPRARGIRQVLHCPQHIQKVLNTRTFTSNPELESFGTPIYDECDDYVDGKNPEVPDELEDDADTYDQYVGAKVELPIGGKMMNAKVRGQKRSADGSVRGRANANPILDTRTYKAKFPDAGQTTEVASERHHAEYLCDV
jgi:hypothetical protein